MNLLVNSYTPKLTITHEPLGFATSPDNMNSFISGSRATSFSPMLSPNICFLDHQETVETGVSHRTADDSLGLKKNDSVTNDLFSFELDANGLPRCLLNHVDELPMDFSWLDIVGATNDPIDLNDINVMPLSSPRSSTTLDMQVTINCDNFDANTPSSKLEAQSLSSSAVSNFSSPFYESDLTAHIHLKNRNCDSKLEDDHVYLSRRGSKNSDAEKYLNNEDLATGKPGQRLCLTTEERKMLQSMGVRLPTRFPLSRAEEKALRTVRRKIRNKLSAQASRIKRQEYMIDLEHRMELSTKENQRLRRHIETLENDKRDLLSHIHKLRAYISKVLNRHDQPTPLPLFVKSRTIPKSGSQAATAAAGGTSLLIVTFMILAWTAMVPFPSMRFFQIDSLSQVVESKSSHGFFPGRSRTLLESKPMENPVSEENLTQDDRLSDPSISSSRSRGKQKSGLSIPEDYTSSIAAVNYSVDGLHAKVDTSSRDFSDDTGPSSAPAVLTVAASMDL